MTARAHTRRALTWLAPVVLLILPVCLGSAYRGEPARVPAAPAPVNVVMKGERLAVELPAPVLLARVASFEDSLLAYLHLEFLRGTEQVDSPQTLLTLEEEAGEPRYVISLVVDNDLLFAVPFLADLRAKGLIRDFHLETSTRSDLERMRRETRRLATRYDGPWRRPLASLGRAELHGPLASFLRFKSQTDRRIRERLEPRPKPLTRGQAFKLAADILAVARFYELPLTSFVGIGAMENNFMNAPGDLEHGVWKRRPEKGDIVLKRRRGRVFVRNHALGVWQVTRETLRYAHALYREDDRDYSKLPQPLRPPATLDLEAVPPRALTTYAGLLFRHLLDEFEGDVEKAVGAYNGGVGKPNRKYAAWVARVADHAGRILEQATVPPGFVVAEYTLPLYDPPKKAKPAAPPPAPGRPFKLARRPPLGSAHLSG